MTLMFWNDTEERRVVMTAHRDIVGFAVVGR